VIPLDKAILFFGRHPDCDVVITSSRKVSRKHCCIVQIDDRFVVRDLGSMNGVRVNGKIVRRQSPLRLGDSLTVGDVVFQVREGAPPKRRVPAPRRAQPTPPPARPLNISQDVPVIIPDQGQSWSGAESQEDEPVNIPPSDELAAKTPLDVDAEETNR
jgi:pSer/pThr/pTyr-binding forkhead associated (FHA) protein